MTTYSGDLRTQLRDLLTDAGTARETAESVSERLYWQLYRVDADDALCSLLAGEETPALAAANEEVEAQAERADTAEKERDEWREVAAETLCLPIAHGDVSPEGLTESITRLCRDVEKAQDARKEALQGFADMAATYEDCATERDTLRETLERERTALADALADTPQELARRVAHLDASNLRLETENGALRSALARERTAQRKRGNAVSVPVQPADTPEGQNAPAEAQTPRVASPAGTYGPALAAYLGRLVDPRKREYARMTADALLAGTVPNGERPELRPALAEEVTARVMRALTQDKKEHSR